MYTKERNDKCGRKGYLAYKKEKETVISPKDYGEFIQKKYRSCSRGVRKNEQEGIYGKAGEAAVEHFRQRAGGSLTIL